LIKPSNSRQSSSDSHTSNAKTEYTMSPSSNASTSASTASTPSSLYSFNATAQAMPLLQAMPSAKCLTNIVSELNQVREHNKTLKSRLDCEMKSISLLTLEKRDLLHRLEQLSIQNHQLIQQINAAGNATPPPTHTFAPQYTHPHQHQHQPQFYIKQQALQAFPSVNTSSTNGTTTSASPTAVVPSIQVTPFQQYQTQPLQSNAVAPVSTPPPPSQKSSPTECSESQECPFTRLSIRSTPTNLTGSSSSRDQSSSSSSSTSASASASTQSQSLESTASTASTTPSQVVKSENGT